jgi:serine protease Do
MFDTFKRLRYHGRFGVQALLATALAFFLSGLLVASELHWIGSVDAANPGTNPQGALAAPARPDSFTDLARALGPTVVNIKVTKVQKTEGRAWPQMPEGPFGELFKRFFEEMPQRPRQFRQQGSGSGVIISQDGYILSNNHVVEDADEVTVTLYNQQEYKAKVIGRDTKTDLAVLKIEPKESLPTATMGDSGSLQVGEWVLAIGNPFGLSHTVTAGIVSAKGRIIGAGPYDDFIQTDAPINPGNSGGPLFNMRGEVVGINTAIIPYGQGIGFAIPANTAKPLIPQLMSKGVVTRGYLGVNIQTITPELAKALKLSENQGALVSDVVPASPADQVGIQRGDIIVAFNDKAVDNSHDLATLAAATPVGTQARVIVLRDGKKKELSLKVGTFPADEAMAQESSQPTQTKWGLQLQDVTPEMAKQRGLTADHGVMVTGVESDSPAAEAGVHPGDILLQVNQQTVHSVADVKKAMTQADDTDTLLLLVQRDRGSFFVALAK